MLDPILVPTWLRFPSQKPQKSIQKLIPRGINFLIDFWMDLLLILPLFRLKWCGAKVFPPFFVALDFFSDFFARDPGVPQRPVAQSRWGTPPGFGFSTIFLWISGPFSAPCWATLPSWLGWWGYAKRKEFRGTHRRYRASFGVKLFACFLR